MIDFIPAGNFIAFIKKSFCKSFEIDICNNKKCVLKKIKTIKLN